MALLCRTWEQSQSDGVTSLARDFGHKKSDDVLHALTLLVVSRTLLSLISLEVSANKGV